jgi:hypothetical protein
MGHKRPPPKTRVVGYTFSGRINVDAAQAILERAVRQHAVTEFTAKLYADHDVVWFNGPPGRALREVRAAIEKLVTRPSSSVSSPARAVVR